MVSGWLQRRLHSLTATLVECFAREFAQQLSAICSFNPARSQIIEIRKRTQNKRGLEVALRAILNAGGTIESEWPLTKALRIGDEATGVPVLSELYEKMKATPAPIDLRALWQRLGVERKENGIEFNDYTPLAPIRQAITKRADHSQFSLVRPL